MIDNTLKEAGVRVAGGFVPLTVWGLTASDWAALVTGLYFTVQTIIILPSLAKTLNGWYLAIKARFDK